MEYLNGIHHNKLTTIASIGAVAVLLVSSYLVTPPRVPGVGKFWQTHNSTDGYLCDNEKNLYDVQLYDVQLYDVQLLEVIEKARNAGSMFDEDSGSFMKDEGMVNIAYNSVIYELGSYYKMTDTAREFISENEMLPLFLMDSKKEIYKNFGDILDTLSLETINDPESKETTLFLAINTKSDIDLALSKLDKFTDSWWLDNMDRAKDKVCVDVMFV